MSEKVTKVKKSQSDKESMFVGIGAFLIFMLILGFMFYEPMLLDWKVSQVAKSDIKITVKDIEVKKEETRPYQVTYSWSFDENSKIATIRKEDKYLVLTSYWWETTSNFDPNDRERFYHKGYIDRSRLTGEFIMRYAKENEMEEAIDVVTSPDSFKMLAMYYVENNESAEKLEADAQKYNNRIEGSIQ